MVEKASTQLRGPSGPRLSSCSWGSDELEIRCWIEEHVPERLVPRLLVEQPRRRGKKCDGHKSEDQYVAVLFGLQLPFTHNPFK